MRDLDRLNLPRDLVKVGGCGYRGGYAGVSRFRRLGCVEGSDWPELDVLEQVVVGRPYPSLTHAKPGQAVINGAGLVAVGVFIGSAKETGRGTRCRRRIPQARGLI